MKQLFLSVATILLLSAAAFAQQDCGTVKDYDGNTYNTVKIGRQCWMAENLKTMHYADGKYIRQGEEFSESYAYWYYPEDNSSNKKRCGLVYNWLAAMNVAPEEFPDNPRGICPNGWHIPSLEEFSELESFISGNSGYICGGNKENTAKAVASTAGWKISSESCAVGNEQSKNNATGFNAVPVENNEYTFFWSSDSDGFSDAYFMRIGFDATGFYLAPAGRNATFSVRCVKDF